MASLEVLGHSIVERTIARLHCAGIKAVSVVNESALSEAVGRRFIPEVLLKQAQKGFGELLLMRLGAYAEVDIAELLDFHHDAGTVATRVSDADGPLDFWVLNTAPGAQRGLDLDSPSCYLTPGYVNRLTGARDLRRLVVDAFLGRCEIRPRGREQKPGVWIDDGARIHRSARVVAPAYIGRGSRVRASALITGFSAVERRCVVDYGTVVEDSSMLPYTYVGKGLEVAHAVVDGKHLVNLSRNVALTIEDRKIADRTLSSRRWFRSKEKMARIVRPVSDVVELEPVPCVTPRQQPALRILSKGEI